ncbi:MAG: Gfo/Idh/MocA family protein [Bacteriovoracaceae bacterium]
MNDIRWGIIGSGKIARRFASDLKLVESAKLIGVAGRNYHNTQIFTQEFGGTAFSSIEELLHSNADVIYVATPHTEHKEHSLVAIRKGKAVLCEKPFTMDIKEAREVLAEAKNRKVFVMEGMWTRFFPAIGEVIDLIRQGKIGKVLQIESSFGYQSQFDPASRVFDPTLGGGSLLDVGVYSVAFAQMLMNEKASVKEAKAVMSLTGVDESLEWELAFSSDVKAKGQSSVVKILRNEAIIKGDKGVISIPRFWCPNEYFLNGLKKEFHFEGRGFQFEAMEVMNCLRKGYLESELVSHQYTLDVMETLDMIREHIGLHYPSRSHT